MNERDEGHCKAGKQEVQRTIRIKLNYGVVTRSPQGIGQVEEVSYPTRLLWHTYELSVVELVVYVRPKYHLIADIVHKRSPRSEFSDYIAPCRSPPSTPLGVEGRDAPSPHNPYQFSHRIGHCGEGF